MKARIPGGAQGGGQMAMMKKIQEMQAQLEQKQAEIEASTFTASAGGGAVEVVANGKKEIISIKIKPEAVDPDDVEMLQDMVMAAVNEAMRTADNEAAQNMSRLTGGMNLGF